MMESAPRDTRPDRAIRILARGIWSLSVLVCTALAGLGGAHIFGLRDVDQSSDYLYVVTVLLAIGLYSSTSGIVIDEMKRNTGTILVAVTVGVLAKAALISGVMWLVLNNGNAAQAILLGVAVAQIDPLAVAGLIARSRMSDSAKTVLRAWSSFDDPVTMLLTIYVLAFASSPGGHTLPAVGSDTNPLALFASFGWNLGFALVVYLGVVVTRNIVGRPRMAALRDRLGLTGAAPLVSAPVLIVVGYVAVEQFLLLGLAAIGLFLRPIMGAVLNGVTRVALLLATAALGVLMVDGVNWLPGLALGLAAFGAQVVLAPIVARKQSRTDRMFLAFGQQNGITAITLALLVEPVLHGTVAIIGPAILVINGLHAVCDAVLNGVYARRDPPDLIPVPDPVPLPAEAGWLATFGGVPRVLGAEAINHLSWTTASDRGRDRAE